jgi:penicillin-insensitive murein endopeptidase
MRLAIKKTLLALFLACISGALIISIPELIYQNTGKSVSIGTVGAGSLKNPYLIPYAGRNFKYFSWLSYYAMDNAYVHHNLYTIVLEAYEICQSTCPKTKFSLMECSGKDGGKLNLQRTHQNGTSIDFAIPMLYKGKPFRVLDHLGLLHYGLDFNNDGHLALNKHITLDFESMAKHILALQKAAKKNGWEVKKVILKIEMKPFLFAGFWGNKLKKSGIYFAQALPNLVNNAHEEHYHVDFSPL